LFNVLARVLLLALGQKLMTDHMSELQQHRISKLVILGLVAFVFFVQGMAAVLVGLYFLLSERYGLPSSCAAFSVAGIAVLISTIFAFSFCMASRQKKTIDFSPRNLKTLALAFVDGFLKGKNKKG